MFIFLAALFIIKLSKNAVFSVPKFNDYFTKVSLMPLFILIGLEY